MNDIGMWIAGITQAVFLTLKLSHVVAWSWLWVTSPVWIWTALVVSTVLSIIFIAGSIAAAFTASCLS